MIDGQKLKIKAIIAGIERPMMILGIPWLSVGVAFGLPA